MENLTLKQLFGRDATQTTTVITIQKVSLPKLTATANNTGEQLLIALLLQAHQQFAGVLTDTPENLITDEQTRTITYNNERLYEKLNLWLWKRQFIKKAERSLILDTFILNWFITPPTEPQSNLNPNSLNY